MTTRRDVFQSWVVDHPAGHGVDLETATYRGFRRFRRWLFLRTVAAILIGAVFVGGMIGLRSAISGGLSPGATASLVVRPGSGNAPLKVSVDGSSSTAGGGATITSYDFDFGDGSSTGPQPKAAAKHTYKRSGTFPVTLTVTDSAGRIDQATQEVTVNKPRPGNPTAKLRVGPRTGEAPLQVTASGSTSTAGKGAEITSYDFDFDDGTTTGPQPDPTATHTYQRPGTYTVTLTVTSSADRTDRTSQDVTVTRPPPSKPKAELKLSVGAVDPVESDSPRFIRADGSGSTAGPGSSIESYEFSFSDGFSTGAQQEATVQHECKTGLYTVTLTVTNSAGQADTTEGTIQVP